MMDKNREAFEAWWEERWHDALPKKMMALAAWLASRQAIEMKKKPYCVWPDETHDDSYINGFNDALDEITYLGIRVKGNEE